MNSDLNATQIVWESSCMLYTTGTNANCLFGFAQGYLQTSVDAISESGIKGSYFVVSDGTLYAVTSVGSSRTTTSITSINTDYWDIRGYRIEHDQAAGEVKFYFNETLEATHTTNIFDISANYVSPVVLQTSQGNQVEMNIQYLKLQRD